ncbi:winged helix-turn-helix domain-containing protein [Pseudooceanicola aestuarii]|uniref:winged helix-turn-helix domain-containing protein n=1 Tax=Pseudooceanicola aestuarii TaxID=2697319 RepID=UPI0013D1D0F2|nr:winged helix-turn-helix domain-containing protein [Pseudooceanicola aestuarii]
MSWALKTGPSVSLLEFDDILLEVDCLRIRRGGVAVHVASTEFQLLATLIECPGTVWHRTALVHRIWGQDAEIDRRTVDVHVARLRKALGQTDNKYPIRTVRGVGYALG